MRFSALRRVASVTLALVWGAARLAQPLQPECPHHAVAVIAAAPSAAESPVPAFDPHAHHHAAQQVTPVAAEHASPSGSHHPADNGAPCECAAHCCAASTVAIAAAVPPVLAVITAPPRVLVFQTRSSAPRALWSRRQPPATAPPTAVV